ncbi:Uncharacterized protein OBRU01_19154, partial [Operophtera brumata]
MNLILLLYLAASVFQLCLTQDYVPSTYNPDASQPSPTNDYYNPNAPPDPRNDPYDPNKRFQSNPSSPNQYDINRNPYDQDQRFNQFENRNDLKYQNPYNPDNTPRPTWDASRTFSTGYKGAALETESVIISEATYFIVASRMVRPGQIYKISANILQARLQMTIRASISCNGVEIADVIQRVKQGVPEILNMRVPPTTIPGDYKLRVEGLYLDTPFGGRAFVNETQLSFSKRFMTIFIQMDKPYQMSDQPLFGEWTIRVEALGQVEETNFLVEEYYQTRYEVNVTMPAFFFNTEPFIHGRIMANYTSGAPVRGNLTLKATIRPIPQYRPSYYTQGQFNNKGQAGGIGYGNNQYTRVRPVRRARPAAPPRTAQPAGPARLVVRPAESGHEDVQLHGGVVPRRVAAAALAGGGRIADGAGVGGGARRRAGAAAAAAGARTRRLSVLPCLQAAGVSLTVPVSVEGRGGALEPQQPQLMPGHDAQPQLVSGHDAVWHLKLDLYKLLSECAAALQAAGVSLTVQVSVEGRGGALEPQQPQLVPGHDAAAGVSLPVQVSVEGRGGALEPQQPQLVPGHDAVWHLKLDLYKLLSKCAAALAGGGRVAAGAGVGGGARRRAGPAAAAAGARTRRRVAPQAGPLQAAQQVGEYIIFHVQSNLYMESFNYVVMSKGNILTSSQEIMQPGAYVGLSGIDNTFYTMQAGNELTYAKATNGTFAYTWRSHFGDADDLVYFPSSTFGIDANRTFDLCNSSLGLGECLEGGCYPLSKKCDGAYDCSDHTDESNCEHADGFELGHFRKFRFNRIQRQYDNVWLWRDVNIGPHGRYVFTVDVPQCRQGEQVGLRVVVFNYTPQNLEAVVVLEASPDYKFVHVRSYNPRTSFGEHQFFVYILSGDAATVHVPVVAARLGTLH